MTDVPSVSNRFSTLTDFQLFHEIDFLFYENGRIARGHSNAVEVALGRAIVEMKSRGFEFFHQFRKQIATHDEQN